MEKPSTARVAIKWGIVSSVFSIIYTIVYYKTSLFEIPILSWITFIFLLFGVFLSIREFKRLCNHQISFNDGLGLGTLMSAISGMIYQSFSNIYNTYIDHSVVEKMEFLYRNQLLSQGLSPEKVANEMEYAARYTTPGLVFIQGLLLHILFGFVFSLIVSSLVKKNNSETNF